VADYLYQVITEVAVWPKRALTEMIALTVYWPIARFAALVERLGRDPTVLPLSWYHDKSFYAKGSALKARA
jgi:hypothetical protein